MSERASGSRPRERDAPPPDHLGWGPLRGIRVVEFGHFVAAPYATLQLAYYGAEVIKIESTSRPDMWRLRESGPNLPVSAPFVDHNKNKLSVTLDLKQAPSRCVIADLVAESDCVIDNFSFGVLERYGLGYDSLGPRRPGLVMLGMPGFGRSGPFRDAVALGPSLQAFSGMTMLWTASDDPEPVGSQTSYADYIVGLHAAFALVCALEHRDRTGEGQYIELAQLDVVLNVIAPLLATAGLHTVDSEAESTVYPCAGHDRWVVIDVHTQDHWTALAAVIPGLVTLRVSTREERVERRDSIRAILTAWTQQRSSREAMETLQAAGVPAGAVHNGKDLVEDPQLANRGFAISTGHPILGDIPLPGPTARHRSDGGPRSTRHAPLLGQDRKSVV